MKLDPALFNKILDGLLLGFGGAFGIGLGLLVIRSVDALKPLAWG